jgi:pimeloyl-ACP methyl ester carboxylesterase
MSIESFRIHFDDAALDDLKQRLARARLPDQMEGVGWDYGTEREYLAELIGYWRDKYDWREHERRLNDWEHFRTVIDGQSIHFLHARSRHENAMPLVISHGWPGTIVEFMNVIEPLRDPEAHGGRAEDAFHVICPSLPGYGFSEPTRSRGWNCVRMADAFIELMARLGYPRYGAQGGDWGALITTEIGRRDPEHVAGIHLNMPLGSPAAGELTEQEQKDLADLAAFQEGETGYQRIQGSKPQTLGYGLNDSPTGLCAWIIEKFRTWSDCNGDVESVYARDDLLTNISVYWLTQTITSSTRLYYEVLGSGSGGGNASAAGERVEVPTGVARFPKEILRFPRTWCEQAYNITHWTDMPKGGHFAAMEQPELYVQDLRDFFATVR